MLAPALPALADEIIHEIGRAIPAYRRPLEGAFGRGLRAGVQEALGQFLGLVGRADGQTPFAREVYRELGRGELRAGRGLDALQAAYRLGARVAWRRLSALARAAGADAAAVSLLAESIFAYIDEISAQSVEGYAQAQAAVAGEEQRRRRRLVRLLVAPEPAGEAVLAQAVAEADWPLPRTLAALAADEDDVQRLVARLGAGAIGARVEEDVCVLVPDPDAPGRREQLLRALAGQTAALGPTVGGRDAQLSFARAREALRLQLGGAIEAGRPIVVAEHLADLLLLRDRALAQELATRRLAPLEALSPVARARMVVTLLSWLRRQGSVPAVADDLHVHRQTVRYRLARLRELFGDALDDPEERFEIELALRCDGRVGAGPDAPRG